MHLIPGKTKVRIELFKGVGLWDIIIGAIALVLITLIVLSSLPWKLVLCIIVGLITAFLLVRLDDEPNYVFVMNVLSYLTLPHGFYRPFNDEQLKIRGKGETLDAFLADEAEETDEEAYEADDEAADAVDAAEEATFAAEDDAVSDEKKAKSARAAKKEKRARAAKKRKEEARENRASQFMEEVNAFTGISDNCIEYAGDYYGAAIEIDPVEFRFFSQIRRNNAIENGIGAILRAVPMESAVNILRIDRPVRYDDYLSREYDKLDELKQSYESGFLDEDELKARIEVAYDRIYDLRNLCYDNKVIEGFYYICLFDKNKRSLEVQIINALHMLETQDLVGRRLGDRDLAIFLKYTNTLDFDEHEIDDLDPEDWARWAMPEEVVVHPNMVETDGMISYQMKVTGYPRSVGDAWLARVMSMPGTKVMIKATPMDSGKAVRAIDFSLAELRSQYANTHVDSRLLELASDIEGLSRLLVTLQGENESLLNVSIYVTVYDAETTRKNPGPLTPANSDRIRVQDMKKYVRRLWSEEGFRLGNMSFNQLHAFIGSQVSAYDPGLKDARGIPSNTIAAAFPWIYAYISDPGGIHMGSSDEVPVFVDFFRRDSERVNSNMVIIGKSGSGKSYCAKSLLANLAAEDAKIFILDPENEYSELCHNLGGSMINVGNAQHGRLNPFHIITALEDDEAGDEGGIGSYSTHLQFLEEFYRQILPDCDRDAIEYLNNLTERMYSNKGITPESDLSRLTPEDYPTFEDLYDEVLAEFERTDNEYLRSMLRTLINHVSKFAEGGRNANLWNGPSTITTDTNFTVFNFQSMLANRNTTIANAQMLLVLKYIDNEIIKNRDYNLKYGLNRKIVVVIDEAHVFIDTKFPVALDFMFQLAKRIRKYNGMQIVITQNVKDFVGTEEIARKSMAIINACQYSFIFALAPNDMTDLCKLYENAGGINEREQEKITGAPRGQAFAILSPQSRSTFMVEVPQEITELFRNANFRSKYFRGPKGAQIWNDYIEGSREKHLESLLANARFELVREQEAAERQKAAQVTFSEVDESGATVTDGEFANLTRVTLPEEQEPEETAEDIAAAWAAMEAEEAEAVEAQAAEAEAPQTAQVEAETPQPVVEAAPAASAVEPETAKPAAPKTVAELPRQMEDALGTEASSAQLLNLLLSVVKQSLRDELKEELRQELKEELRRELAEKETA